MNGQQNEAAPEKKLKIVVAGDQTIDWFTLKEKPVDRNQSPLPKNWQLEEQVRSFALRGGSLLLADMVQACVHNATVLTNELPGCYTKDQVHEIPPRLLIHSHAELKMCKMNRAGSKSSQTCLRVARYNGFSGPSYTGQQNSIEQNLGTIRGEDGKADIVVLDDPGNGYRDLNEELWPKCLRNDKTPFIVYKHHQPLFTGRLFEHIRQKHSKRTICILEADNLRDYGVRLSRGISWEKTVDDFVQLVQTTDVFNPVLDMLCVMVRLGKEGAIVFLSREYQQSAIWLCYSSEYREDRIGKHYEGSMNGVGCAFAAGVVKRLAGEQPDKWSEDSFVQAAEKGIRTALKHHYLGFHRSDSSLTYTFFAAEHRENGTNNEGENEELGALERQVYSLGISGEIKNACISGEPWSIAQICAGSGVEDSAHKWVQTGALGSFERVPIATFGIVHMVDRAEIESASSVEILLENYLNRHEDPKPLSIAVFGQPGSGKSFGIKQIALFLSKNVVTKGLTFNLSEFAKPSSLTTAFHRIREVALSGKVPLALFDEFDSPLEGEPLGWLRYFLAPMEDGEFRDGEQINAIGRAILVFAGGTKYTYADFVNTYSGLQYATVKAPDFISRLKGYIDASGPNPPQPSGEAACFPYIGETQDERSAILRRSTVLRGLLKRHNLVDEQNGRALVDESLLRAMLRIGNYKHGIRSMDAILNMSVKGSGTSLGPSSLPPAHLLDMHVDADDFNLTLLFVKARDSMARFVYTLYRQDNQNRPLSQDEFEDLKDEVKADNRGHFDSIPRKLAAIRCRVVAKSAAMVQTFEFNKEEIDLLAKMEHERWCRDKIAKGWRYGKGLDEIKKIHPLLKPWDELSAETQAQNKKMIERIPEILEQGGLVIIRER